MGAKCETCGYDLPFMADCSYCELVKAADRLAYSKGHDRKCRFTGCTCGAVEEQKAALSDYWKLRRVNQ